VRVCVLRALRDLTRQGHVARGVVISSAPA